MNAGVIGVVLYCNLLSVRMLIRFPGHWCLYVHWLSITPFAFLDRQLSLHCCLVSCLAIGKAPCYWWEDVYAVQCEVCIERVH